MGSKHCRDRITIHGSGMTLTQGMFTLCMPRPGRALTTSLALRAPLSVVYQMLTFDGEMPPPPRLVSYDLAMARRHRDWPQPSGLAPLCPLPPCALRSLGAAPICMP